MSRIQVKDPDDVDDFGWDWTEWLAAGETIAAKEILPSVPVGIAAGVPTEAAGVVTARLSGGDAGSDYEVTCRVTTSAGRQLDGTIRVYVRQR